MSQSVITFINDPRIIHSPRHCTKLLCYFLFYVIVGRSFLQLIEKTFAGSSFRKSEHLV